MDPHQELGIARVVRRPRRIAAARLACDPVDPAVHVPDARRGLLGPLGAAEHDLGREVERPVEAAPRVLAVVRVLGHAGCHQRMCDLKHQRSAASQEQDALPVDSPRERAGAEQARIAHGRQRTGAAPLAGTHSAGPRKLRTSPRRGPFDASIGGGTGRRPTTEQLLPL